MLFKPNPHLRPTSDKVRQALFNMLQGELEGKVVLDLFSGTGALGIEAISAGAARVVFVEADRAAARAINENLKRLGAEEKGEVVPLEVSPTLERLVKCGEKFDLIFLDPPYEKGLAEKTLVQLGAGGLLKAKSLVISECRKTDRLPKAAGRLVELKTKSYGDTRISIYRST